MPAVKKHQVHPVHPDDLVCGTCPARQPYQADPAATRERARAARWHVYQGPSLTGKELDLVLCPDCFKAGGDKRPAGTPVLEGQLDLPGLITPVPVEKSKPRSKRSAQAS